MNREDILAEALNCVEDRGENYGTPSQNFKRIASLWSVVLAKEVSVAEVGAMMVCLKLARLAETPDHRDSWVDIAGYAAVTAEAIACTAGIQPPLSDQQNTEPTKQVSHYEDL